MPSIISTPPAQWLAVSAAALVDTEGRVLVQRRPEGVAHAGLWEFPGGKIELGESPEAALVRELREELAITVEPALLAPACFASEKHGERHLLLLLFVCREWKGVPRPLEASELRWLVPPQLHALDMPPADRPLIRLLEALL
jgi:8-oxo-dGTP diphosphatase